MTKGKLQEASGKITWQKSDRKVDWKKSGRIIFPMLTKPVLEILANKYLVDAEVLLTNRRYAAAVYLAGYSLELGLKYNICETMGFDEGFPESSVEFSSYSVKKSSIRQIIKSLREIRHHKLKELLFYSGRQNEIETNFFSDWDQISGWTPEMRYQNLTINKWEAAGFLSTSRRILKILL